MYVDPNVLGFVGICLAIALTIAYYNTYEDIDRDRKVKRPVQSPTPAKKPDDWKT